jgi:plastocyanin
MKRVPLALAVALTLIAGAAAAQPATVQVKATLGRNFDPKEVTIPLGGTVEWKNTACFAHTVTFDPAKAKDPSDVILPAGVAPFDSGKLGGGKTWSHTFTQPGHYQYVCLPHEGHGMIGVVNVTAR